MLLFPTAFWSPEGDTFGRVAGSSPDRGEFFLFYSYGPAVSGGNVLIGLVAGEAAVEFEQTSDEEAVVRCVAVLRGIFGKQGVAVPDPVASVCTRWASDPLSCGSYSHVAVGASGDDYDAVAAPVAGRLFFAGEATTRKYPATMHGAFFTGLREAERIAATLQPVRTGGGAGRRAGTAAGAKASKGGTGHASKAGGSNQGLKGQKIQAVADPPGVCTASTPSQFMPLHSPP